MTDDPMAGKRQLLQVTASGSSRDVGRVHGETLRAEISDGLRSWRASIERRHALDADAYIAEFLASTSFLPVIERWTPALLEEVRGIAEGAAQPFPTILAYNLMDEEWAFGARRALAAAPGCTAVALVGGADGAPVIAQTMDLPSVHDGAQTVLLLEPEGQPTQWVFTAAGMLGLNGANADGIGVVVNNLAVLPASASGLPVMFMVRGILAQRTHEAACALVRSAPHEIGQHYLIGSPEGVASFEGCATGVRRDLATERGRFAHANHPLVSEPEPGDHEADYAATNTRARQRRADELLVGLRAIGDAEELLRDQQAPISRSPLRGGMTFGATSIVCSSPPRVRIAPGPPHSEPFLTIT